MTDFQSHYIMYIENHLSPLSLYETDKTMKKRLFLILILTFALFLCICSCENTEEKTPSSSGDLVTFDVDLSEYLENGTVKLTMNNNSAGEFSYTEGYSLMILRDGTWYDVPFIDPYFSELEQTLSAGESISTYEYFTERLGTLPAGTYLVTRSGELRMPTSAGDTKHYYVISASEIFELPDKTVKAEVK